MTAGGSFLAIIIYNLLLSIIVCLFRVGGKFSFTTHFVCYTIIIACVSYDIYNEYDNWRAYVSTAPEFKFVDKSNQITNFNLRSSEESVATQWTININKTLDCESLNGYVMGTITYYSLNDTIVSFSIEGYASDKTVVGKPILSLDVSSSFWNTNNQHIDLTRYIPIKFVISTGNDGDIVSIDVQVFDMGKCDYKPQLDKARSIITYPTYFEMLDNITKHYPLISTNSDDSSDSSETYILMFIVVMLGCILCVSIDAIRDISNTERKEVAIFVNKLFNFIYIGLMLYMCTNGFYDLEKCEERLELRNKYINRANEINDLLRLIHHEHLGVIQSLLVPYEYVYKCTFYYHDTSIVPFVIIILTNFVVQYNISAL